jgi:hypothetical protein
LAAAGLFDAYGVYDWMFIASLAIGIAAVAVALAFPPFPSQARATQLQPA